MTIKIADTSRIIRHELKYSMNFTLKDPKCGRHTGLPKNCVFRNRNHQNLEHGIIFWNTSANVSPHLWNKSGCQFLRENHRAIYLANSVQLRMLFLLITLAVNQSNHFTTAPGISEFTHVSPFSSTVMKRQFSWSAFLNIWRHHLFAGDGFAGARSIDSTTFSFKHKTFLQMAPWFWRSIQLAALRMQCSLRETLFLLRVFHTRTEHFREQICIFLSFMHAHRIQKRLQ